jgi:hypothetical protein
LRCWEPRIHAVDSPHAMLHLFAVDQRCEPIYFG